MSLRKPKPKYGWTGQVKPIMIGTTVRYRADRDSPDFDEDYTLRAMTLPSGEVLGEVTDGPEDDDGRMWEVVWDGVLWAPSTSPNPLDPWWTYEELLEVV